MLNTKLRRNNNLAEQLAEQEKLIKRKSEEWYLEGKALLEIRDKKLYLGKHRYFADYCQKKWGFSKRYANMQISAYLFVSHLGEMVPTLPANERQARFFTGLNPELQQAAWIEALRTAPNKEMTAAHADAVAKKYKTGSQSSGTKAGTRNAEDITAPSFPAVEVSCHQAAVDLSSSHEDEEQVQLIKLLEQEKNLRLQSQYEGLLKDQRINTLESQVFALNSHNTVLVRQSEENQYQINALKQQVNTMGQQIANLMNQVSHLLAQYNQLHFVHTHLTAHAYNLQEALKRVEIESNLWKDFVTENWRKIPGMQTEEKQEKVIRFFPPRKDSDQAPQQRRAGN
jgi:phosphoribosylaminoimidazole-succinocarboxamide synthase